MNSPTPASAQTTSHLHKTCATHLLPSSTTTSQTSMTASTARPPPITDSSDSPPTFNYDPLLVWANVNEDETIKAMGTIHSGSLSDPCLHHIFNKASATIAPHLCKDINISFETAIYPESWKHAEIKPLLTKPMVDPRDLKNFRPVSLLPFPANVIEKIVNRQLTHCLEENNILDPSQSGFRSNHSTETSLIAATTDIRARLDNGETAALILLDLSAAFDTVCHHILRTRLHNAGIWDKALEWTTSFLSGRTQSVHLPPFRFEASKIICDVPQGLSLSTALFNVYMSPLAHVARQHNLNIISYANDTQLILSLTKDPLTAKSNLHERKNAVAKWMRNSKLKLNSDKMEVLILGANPSAWDDSWWPTALGAAPKPTNHARNLGIILDSTLSMTK
ncbi:transcription termination factor 4, mitochondrial isoform X1 [Pleurodeles waltl]|uniref:transcription termination factor 4, mitochondrial isoform X1 n=1 Tax=Pleurodeles waltl TaxID=8319 RepID=UPI0037094558